MDDRSAQIVAICERIIHCFAFSARLLYEAYPASSSKPGRRGISAKEMAHPHMSNRHKFGSGTQSSPPRGGSDSHDAIFDDCTFGGRTARHRR